MTRFEIVRDLMVQDPTAWALGQLRDRYYATNAAVLVFFPDLLWQALHAAAGGALARTPSEAAVVQALPSFDGVPAVDLGLEFHQPPTLREHLYLVDQSLLAPEESMTKAISLDTVRTGKGESDTLMSQSYSLEFKQQVVREARETGNAALVARQHQLSPSMVRRWVREALTAEYPDPQALSLAEENERLKRLLAERDLQIAMLQDFLRKKGIRW